MEKKSIPKKDSNGKKDSQLRKEAMKVIRMKQLGNLFLILILVLVLATGGLFVYVNTANVKADSSTPGILRAIIDLNDRLVQKKEAIAAVVNNDAITAKELDDRYNLLPSDYQSLITRQQMLSQMIDEKILLQQAAKLNVTTTNEEIDARIQALLDQNQINQTQFEQALAMKNITMQTVRDFYSKETILTKLVTLEVLPMVVVNSTDISDYYKNNPSLFQIPESVNVSHILICHNESVQCTSNLSKAQALAKAQSIWAMVNLSNFAQMATNYSDEPAAKMTNGNLGWVSKESQIDETFMNATFALSAGQISKPVETVFGYHIIAVFEKRNASVLNLSSVSSQINQTLVQNKEKDTFDAYMSQLRNESTIINYVAQGTQN